MYDCWVEKETLCELFLLSIGEMFRESVVDMIMTHDDSTPLLFLYRPTNPVMVLLVVLTFVSYSWSLVPNQSSDGL